MAGRALNKRPVSRIEYERVLGIGQMRWIDIASVQDPCAVNIGDVQADSSMRFEAAWTRDDRLLNIYDWNMYGDVK